MFLQFLLVLPCLFIITASNRLEEGIQEFINTNQEPNYMKNAIKEFLNGKNKTAQDQATCEACRIIVAAGIKLQRSGASRESFKFFFKQMCMWFTNFGKPVCQGLTKIDTVLLYILDNKPDLSPQRTCSIILQTCNCVDREYIPWSIDIPPENSSFSVKNQQTPSGGGIKKILHLSDIHYDPLYQPGNNVICNETICCANISGNAVNPDDGAGYWGDYHVCDTPWHSILNLLAQIKSQHSNIDWVYFTGDVVDHRSWTVSIEEKKRINMNSIKKVIKELKETFDSNVPIYFVLGNNDAQPKDLYTENVAVENISTQWLLDLAAQEWSPWLPNSTQITIRKGGFYTALIQPGFRIIGLNSNVCFVTNLWLLYNEKDPYGQLQWLATTLWEAEKNNEFVHILSHIPPGDSKCLKQWSHEFKRIINRFSHIISGQFNGHTHKDELKIFYHPDKPDQVINVAFNGGSVTTFVGFNPNYRIYDVDDQNFNVLDYEQWSYDLTEANMHSYQTPNWFKLYSFKESYGLNRLEPSDYHDLLRRMASNYSLIEQYRRFQARKSQGKVQKPCNRECLTNILSSITTVEYN